MLQSHSHRITAAINEDGQFGRYLQTPIWKRLKSVETPIRYRNLYFDEPVSGASSEARVGGKLVVAFVGGGSESSDVSPRLSSALAPPRSAGGRVSDSLACTA